MSKRQSENLKKWVKALRSKKYAGKQCQYMLGWSDKKTATPKEFCVIGLAYHVFGGRKWKVVDDYTGGRTFIPDGVKVDKSTGVPIGFSGLVGLTKKQLALLIDMNDRAQSFEFIADEIELMANERGTKI